MEEKLIHCNTIDEVDAFLKKCKNENIKLPSGLTRGFIIKQLKSYEHDIKEVVFREREHDVEIFGYEKRISDIFVSTHSGDDKYYCKKSICMDGGNNE